MSEPPVGERVDSDGRAVCVYRSGHGAPAVVIEAGANCIAADYVEVVDGVATFTECVAYDRPGLGWSDSTPRPRTPTAIARDLRALLRNLRVAPPYVLVGHSLGGLYVRRFAELFPTDVAALVLVDPTHPKQRSARPRWAHTEVLHAVRVRPSIAESVGEIATMRPKVPRALIAARVQALRRPTTERVLKQQVASAYGKRSLVGARPLPRVPVVVISAGLIDPIPGLSRAALEALYRTKRHLHDQLVGSIPGGALVVARRSGHMVMWQQPKVIVREIRKIIGTSG